MKLLSIILACFCLSCSSLVFADTVVIDMYLTSKDGVGKAIGTITAQDTKKGLLLTPKLSDLPQQIHGFHIHENPSCDKEGMAAGGHLDPQHTSKHEGPVGQGHLGDLPILIVDKEGKATESVLAPRLTVTALKGHSIMIHKGGDNYADKPEKLGGGGARIACGVVK
ncbi:superoxide dismutase family protein [soil metagenome]